MGKRLYVGNLSYETNEDTLRAAFSEGGLQVADVHMVMDRESGRPRGFAFVEMATEADAQTAIQNWEGRPLDGRNLRVNEAREREPRGGGGRGGHRGF